MEGSGREFGFKQRARNFLFCRAS